MAVAAERVASGSRARSAGPGAAQEKPSMAAFSVALGRIAANVF